MRANQFAAISLCIESVITKSYERDWEAYPAGPAPMMRTSTFDSLTMVMQVEADSIEERGAEEGSR